jgi:PAS domain S-box-containing protein
MADEKGWIFWYNRRWFDYTGTTLPEVEGWGWQKVHHPDHVQGVVEKIRHCFQTGEVWEDTFPLRGRDGNYRWFLSRAVPIRDEEGKVTRWFGTNTDVTEQRNVEQALRESEARLRTLVESNVIGVIFSRENGTITDANEAFLKIVGYSRQELEAGHVNWIDLTPEEYLYLDAHGIAEAKERGACTPYEKEYLRKDGTRVPVLIGYAPLENPPDEYVAFTLDLTDLKQAEATIKQYADQLERSNRDLEDFAFVASHDLQEPLRKIQGFSKLLQGQLGDQLDETSLDYLERMQDAANRMNRMTEALLNYSRVSTKAQPFTMVDLNHVIREVLSDLEFRVEQSDGSVKVGELPTIEADPVQMRQLLQNLIGNALKFHKKDTPPCVQVRAEIIGKAPGGRRMVRLEVQDNGIGINPDFAERIFQPFQRLHGRSEYEGSGMGLAICRKIVERHAGTISVQSAPEGGSLFVATLPLRQKGRLT